MQLNYLFETFVGRDWAGLYAMTCVVCFAAARWGGRTEGLVSAAIATRFILLMLFSSGFTDTEATWRREYATILALDLGLAAFAFSIALRHRIVWPVIIAALALSQVLLGVRVLENPDWPLPAGLMQRALSWAMLIVLASAMLPSLRRKAPLLPPTTLRDLWFWLFSFGGRIGRRPFLSACLALVVGGVGVGKWFYCLGFVTASLMPSGSTVLAIISLLGMMAAILAVSVSSIALSARRARDCGFAPWAVVVGLIACKPVELAVGGPAVLLTLTALLLLAFLPPRAPDASEDLAEVFGPSESSPA